MSYENLTPPEKKPQRGTFTKYWIIFLSAICSNIFVVFLSIGALFYHLYQKIAGIETNKVKDNSTPNFTPRQPYKNIKKMKATDDLRYYALQLELDLQEYKVTTEDGFILTLHRLINPKDTDIERQHKHPILLQHGLLSCSGAYLTSGYNSIAYYLVESGYDVWMGNNRSWFETKHAFLEGNLMHNEQYWDWDVRELAYYDLPCLIENVLSHKPNHSQLTLTGHSQGCTQSFLMLKNGNLGEIHKKINLMVCLAPAIFPGSLFHYRSFIKFMHSLGPTSFKIVFGTCSFLPNLTSIRHLLFSTRIFGSMSYMMFKYLFGWNGSKWGNDHRLWHRHFIFNVSYVSTKLMNWWLSDWVEEGFSNQLQPKAAYLNGDHCAFTPVNSAADAALARLSFIEAENEAREQEIEVKEKDDSKTYFPYKQPWFGVDERSTTVPMLIFTGQLDFLVDGDRLSTHMRHYERQAYLESSNLTIVELDDHSHLDVVWAEDVIGRIGYVMTDKLAALYGENAPEKVKVEGDANVENENEKEEEKNSPTP